MDINDYIDYMGMFKNIIGEGVDYLKDPEGYGLDVNTCNKILEFLEYWSTFELDRDDCELNDGYILFSFSYCITEPNESNGSGEFGGYTIGYGRNDEMLDYFEED